ncbi:GntR family transcriptional regulator [Sphingomonas hengshuiensis]|uniref:GntR family transcriptional regulator n=1 Tax=Sphingomonas hengshuiensis TaxID=1609977 RepID=UPI000B005292|nr:GntR family transcriptional regulator [Sphingomonas hengshuiensis]
MIRITPDCAATGANPAFGTPKQLSEGGVKTSLVQQVYTVIMESLDSGALQGGSRIVASELASRLGVSRAPVREALAVLAGQGLVELLADRGARLRPMSRRDLAGVYEISGPVAAVGVRAAAARIGEGNNAARVEAAMDRIRVARQFAAGVEFYLVLNDFHYLINEIAEKPSVDMVLRAINIEYWNRLLAQAIDLKVHADRYVRNYARLTDAVLAGDGRAAEAVMLSHVEWCASLLSSEG